MTISGSSVYKEIKNKKSEIENQHGDLERKIYDFEKEITSLTDEKEEIYSKLAITYLPGLDAQSVQTTLTEVQSQVKAIFKEKQKKRKDLEDKMNNYQAERKKFEVQLRDMTAKLNDRVSEREKLREDVANNLSSNNQYKDFDMQAKQANERLVNYRKRVEEVEKEAKEKLPGFESNKLFSYLLKRKFGSDEYQKSGLIQKLDSWVANIINFSESKKCYDFLKSMPDLMKIEVEKREEELSEIVEKMKVIEKEAFDRYGLTKVLEEGKQIVNERDGLLKNIEEISLKYEKYSVERKDLDSKKDPYHIEAVQKLKSFLKGETIQELKEKARATPGTEDDHYVERINSIDSQIRTLKDKTKETKEERDKLYDKFEGLKNIETNFSKRDYDSSRAYFSSDFNINTLLIGYLAGRMTSNHVNSSIGDSHHFKPQESYHSSDDYSSSYHSSESSYHSSGGGFGGGGFSSGGGFGGGGGFSSGHGF